MLNSIGATAFLLLMLMDPFGNLPVFVSLLGRRSDAEYRWIIIRESLFALIVMGGALLLGDLILQLLHLTGERLSLAGGLILFIIGIRMVFSTFGTAEGEPEKEPYIVPLAVPLICGPGLIAIIVTLPEKSVESLTALLLAWLVQLGILLCGKKVAAVLGDKFLEALESLMGLLLTGISVGMILDSINAIYGIGGA